MADKQKYMDWLDEHAGIFSDISDKIWEYAELSLMEYQLLRNSTVGKCWQRDGL